MMMTPLVQDIRTVCHEVLPGWTEEGVGNVLGLPGGFLLRVTPAGLLNRTWVQVWVTRKDAPDGTAIPFFREMSRYGQVRDRLGNITPLRMPPADWLVTTINEAVAWAASQPPEG